MTTYLEFEKPIAELESKIAELRHLPNSGDVDIAEEVMRLQDKVQKQIRATYARLTPWQRVLVARHAERPHAQRYIDRLIEDYTPLAGDRLFGDDPAILGGIGIGLIWAALINSVGRNPAAAGAITTTAWVSFALVEALAIFALVIALIILFG